MSEKRKLIVLGGSFNPPTKAHRLLMDAAMASMSADLGVYVPSSDFYVHRKNDKKTDTLTFTEEERSAMLKAMCTDRTTISSCEYGDRSKGRTLKTLRHIQKEYPDMEVCFLIGCDKLDVFRRWPDARTILEGFRLIWVGRDGTGLKAALSEHPMLAAYESHMSFLPQPEEADGISSSLFWKRVRTNDESAYGLLVPEMADIVRRIVEKGCSLPKKG